HRRSCGPQRGCGGVSGLVGGGLVWRPRAEPAGPAFFPSTLARPTARVGYPRRDWHGVPGVDHAASRGTTVMASLLRLLAALVRVAAAVRSTWSPCGLSMLSSITPFGERSRGHRYGATAAWFVVGSTLGGACLGGVAAVVAVVAAAGHLSSHPAWAVGSVALVAAGAVAVDGGLFGDPIPIWGRQVNDAWLSRYRSWVYGAGFGWQLGVGVATYIMTAAVFAVPLLAGATAEPLTAVAICTLYGLVRGVAVLLTSRAQTPVELRA